VKCHYVTVTTTTEAEGGQPDLACAQYRNVVMKLRGQPELACDRYRNVVEAEVSVGLWPRGSRKGVIPPTK
jgi:hypothetical protein